MQTITETIHYNDRRNSYNEYGEGWGNYVLSLTTMTFEFIYNDFLLLFISF